LLLDAAQGHGAKPHQPAMLGAGGRSGEQERHLRDERIRLTGAEIRLAMRVQRAE
jgi:hypothetical protein